MVERLVVIGGDAAGMSAAATARRRAADSLDVVVLERTDWTSYSACGIPYWVAGDVDGPDGLVVRTPEQHRERGLDVRTGVEAVAVDLAARIVTVRPTEGGAERPVGFDQLVVATGAEPVRPDVPGADAAGVHGVQTLDDGCGCSTRSGGATCGEPWWSEPATSASRWPRPVCAGAWTPRSSTSPTSR